MTNSENIRDPGEHEKHWEPCAKGLLENVVRTGVNRNVSSSGAEPAMIDRRRWLAIAAGGTFVAATATIASRFYAPESSPMGNGAPGYGGISCANVLKNIEGYIAHSLDDESMEDKIDQHLVRCVFCRSKYEGMVSKSENQTA